MLLLALMFAPTVAQIAMLSPKGAGNLALAGQAHREIVAVETADTLFPQNTAELEVLERPDLAQRGCVRRRWRLTFRFPLGADRLSASLQDSLSAEEIAPARQACPTAGYVRLNLGTATDQGFDALAELERIRSGERKIGLRCVDETSSGLCRSDMVTRGELKLGNPGASRAGRVGC